MVNPSRGASCRVAFVYFVLIVVAIVLAVAPTAVWGQTTNTGTIVGTVTDSTKAVVPGANVTLLQRSTSSTRSTVTNAEGHYVFANVDPGVYDVRVTKSGFSVAVVPNAVVQVGTQLTENVVMQIGATSTTVEVTTTPGAELQTLNSTVGTTIGHEELVQLANVGRDATTFATLQPGTNINGNTAGAVTDQNTFQLDGGTITDDMAGDSNTYVPSFTSDTAGVGVYHSPGNSQAPSGVVPTPVDSIQEFKVAVANQTADFNGGAGGQVQMVTRSGTGAFHGSVYEYYTDNNFGGANTWDNNNDRPVFKQPSAHSSRFGLSAGGPIIPFNFLGGKTYIFGLYEGYRDPFSESFDRSYPTASLRAGLLKLNGEVVNLNPGPGCTTDPGTTNCYAANTGTCISSKGCKNGTGGTIPTGALDPCPGVGGCDPRGLGINPVILNLWNTYLPLPNDFTHGDGLNYAGYKGSLALPQTSNFGVARIDHDFGQKWHFNGTYHYYRLNRATANQVDVGGFFPGDVKGQYKSTSNRPQVPWYYTASMTTEISPSMTNAFTYSNTRNWWAYGTFGGVPNVAGYPAALEIGGETSGSFGPYNTDNQNTRTRYWNGHDNTFRDDLTKIKGNHLFQFGGTYEHNFDAHLRIDNGGSINTFEQYLIGEGNSTNPSGVDFTGSIPSGISSTSKYKNLYAEVLGIVDQTQSLYTRSVGPTLNLKPRTSCAVQGIAATAGCISSPAGLNQSVIPTYNLYFTDAWQIKPKLTVSYGLGWTVEMPPYEAHGNQDMAVDANGNTLDTFQYLAARQSAALQGISYDPPVGFAAIPNVNGHPKYPYNPFYKGFSPRVSLAWNFTPNTVIRGGWARVFGRLNGVDLVLVPLLAPGLLQTAVCAGPTIAGTCGGTTDNAFRVGVDGTTANLAPPTAKLPQPWYPGINDVATGSGEALDPNFRPNRSDEFDLSIQRQLNPKVQVEVGYIGRIIRNEYQAYDINPVVYMMTQGGQTFANAWGNLMKATNSGNSLGQIPVQPFFEAALGGPTSTYCSGFASCTAAFVNSEGAPGTGNMGCACAFDAYNDVSRAGAFVFGRSLLSDPLPGAFGANGQASSIFENTSNGYGSYNGGYISLSFQGWHGLTMKTNLTYSKSLGTGAVVQATSEYTVVDPFNLHNMYGVQPFDETYSYNLYFTYNPPFYQGQQGLVGKLLGGWSISPLFVAGSGFPVEANTANGSCESFGEGNCNDESTYENAVALGPLNYTNSRKENVFGSNGVGTAGAGQNVFTNPEQESNLFRNPILGVDGQIGGGGPLRGLPFWNLDLAVNKNIKLTERLNTSLYWAFTNVLNHMQAADPSINLADLTTFGVLGGGGNVQANTPRRLVVGLHVDW